MRCIVHHETADGDLADVDYYCSAYCVPLAPPKGEPIRQDDGSTLTWYLLPCSDETQSDVMCAGCGKHLWHGLDCWDDDMKEPVHCPVETCDGRHTSLDDLFSCAPCMAFLDAMTDDNTVPV